MDAVKSDAIDKKLRLIERKLDERDRVPDGMAVNSNVTAMENRLNVDDKMVLVKNLPFGMQDEEDANKLVRDGLGLNIKIQSVSRKPSLYNRAGVMTIQLLSNDDKMLMMTNKWKLRRTENYYDVYVEDSKPPINSRIERKLQMLVHNVQSELANITVPSYSYGRNNDRQ